MGLGQGALAPLGMSRPDPAFWAGKRVLLTGHTGFKGSWAGLWLARLGAEVTGLALAPDQTPALATMLGEEHLAASHLVDLRDRRAVTDTVAGQPFDLVLHMAAQPIVRAAIEDPVGSLATNIMGTAHLLEALRDEDALKAVLVITSDKVYANNDAGRAFQEGDALGGKDPYSASKACAEIVTASFAKSYFDKTGVPVATARGGNVIGGGDFSRDRLVAGVPLKRLGEPMIAAAETDDLVARGKALAQKNCAWCHAIGKTGDSPNPRAPAWRHLHKRHPILALRDPLTRGIARPHDEMPNFKLTDEEVDTIVAYINSL